MPRPLVYGNGRFLIAFDRRHRARDLFFPNVGYPNHLLGHTVKTGIWSDGEFGWCDADDWDIRQDYERSCLVGRSLWRSWKAGFEIDVQEAAHPEEALFVRRFRVTDLRGLARNVTLFSTQNLIHGQSDVGNTAFWNPFCQALVHYRGPYCTLVAARASHGGPPQYATGLTGFGDLEGTWRDAEDGRLSANPIAQGSVDSTIGVGLAADGLETLDLAFVCGSRLDEVVGLLERSEAAGWDEVFERTRTSGQIYVSKAPALELSERIGALVERSLLLVRSQIDHEGAIVAANDSDILATNRATYSYCWPRDGACVSRVMASLGSPEIAEGFLQYCRRIEPRDQPFFLQKYRSDGNLGASWHPWIVNGRPEIPFQEDETALVLLLLAEQAATLSGDWEPFGRKLADAIVAHRAPDGTPLPSWDLWEERHGVHFFTACTAVAALLAASTVWSEAAYAEAARGTLEALETVFWNGTSYDRMIGDATLDSAVLGGMLLCGGLDPDRQRATFERLEEGLTVRSPIGGLARYEGDYYFRQTDLYPGNPWVISTMWSARMSARFGDTGSAWKKLEWVVDRAETTGVLAEQYHPETGAPLSVSPLTWSHTEFLETAALLGAS
ncbi:MAG: glycoside hydrolase family 15 protein [Armatimonadetes bacterium]|nr:glycoside hydrolase family 15 protein [Armatimonadota bacterium]